MDKRMQVKQAVAKAIEHINVLFEHEQLSNLGLEEVEFDHQENEWVVTVGFSRPWDYPAPPKNAIVEMTTKTAPPKRSFKMVRINDTSEHVMSVKNWVSKDALPF